MQLPFVFTKSHGRQSYLKLQKWLIWTEVTNTWVGLDKIPYDENSLGITQKDHVERKLISFNMQKLEKCDPRP
jgi:hypothetical protein